MLIKGREKINSKVHEIHTDTVLHGHVLVQTFDDLTGKITDEKEADNTFQTEALNALVKLSGINGYSTQNPFFNSMRSLLLFHEKIKDGDYRLPLYAVPFGMANSRTDNTNKDMGSLNPNEVVSYSEGYMSVYDFSTSQCNGDLKSVGYYNQKYINDGAGISIPSSVYPSHFVGLSEGNLFYLDNNKKLCERHVGYKRPVFINGLKSDFEDSKSTQFTDYPANFTICSDGICRSYYITSAKKLRELIFNPSILEYAQTDYDVAGIEYSCSTNHCTTDPDNNYIYCFCDGGGANNRVIYKIQKSNMTIVNSVNEYLNWGWAFAKYFNGGIFLITHNGKGGVSCGYWFDPETFYVHGVSFNLLNDFVSNVATYESQNISNLLCDKDGIYSALLGTAYTGGSKYIRFASCCPLMLTTYNLSETITKTASQTMKITYTLMEES